MARGKILVIDDEIGAREFLRDFLEDRDFNVTIAEDGQAGVEIFEKDPSFDLILCDMLMPRMIGLQVLQRVKAIKPDQLLILMTGVKDDSMKEKAKALGCHLYLTKPVQLTEVEARVLECFPDK